MSSCVESAGSNRVNTDEIYSPMFHKPLALFGRVIHSDTGFYTCVMSSLYPATREQTIYGSETRQLHVSYKACDPNSGKYGRGIETTDIDRKITDIYNFHQG